MNFRCAKLADIAPKLFPGHSLGSFQSFQIKISVDARSRLFGQTAGGIDTGCSGISFVRRDDSIGQGGEVGEVHVSNSPRLPSARMCSAARLAMAMAVKVGFTPALVTK